jgi:hypothetical protein
MTIITITLQVLFKLHWLVVVSIVNITKKIARYLNAVNYINNVVLFVFVIMLNVVRFCENFLDALLYYN